MIKAIIGRGIGFSIGQPGYIVTHGFGDLAGGGVSSGMMGSTGLTLMKVG